MARGGSRAARGASLGWLAASSALLVVACTSPAATLLPTSAATPAGAPPAATPATTLAVTPVPTNAAGIRTCVSSSQGPERSCALDAGTYATVFLKPGLTYSVPSTGWASLNREASPGNFHLFPPGGSLAGFQSGVTDDITVLSSVVAPGTCTAAPSTKFPATFAGLVDFLTTDPHVTVSHVRNASVAGLDGKVLDIAFLRSDGCQDGVYTDVLVGVGVSHGAFGITPHMTGVRVYLLHLAGSDTALAILLDDANGGGSDYGDGEGWYAAAQGVIDTFVFTP